MVVLPPKALFLVKGADVSGEELSLIALLLGLKARPFSYFFGVFEESSSLGLKSCSKYGETVPPET